MENAEYNKKPKITAEQYLAAKKAGLKTVIPAEAPVAPAAYPIEMKDEALSAFDQALILAGYGDLVSKEHVFESNEPAPVSKDDIIALARSLGLEIQKPRVKWAKHSFEYHEDTLNQFKQMIRQLGYASIKEATQEMMQEWINKRQAEYERRLAK